MHNRAGVRGRSLSALRWRGGVDRRGPGTIELATAVGVMASPAHELLEGIDLSLHRRNEAFLVPPETDDLAVVTKHPEEPDAVMKEGFQVVPWPDERTAKLLKQVARSPERWEGRLRAILKVVERRPDDGISVDRLEEVE